MITVTAEQSSTPPTAMWIKEVCKAGHGHDCCRYLVCGARGFGCAKHHAELRGILDTRVAAETIVARGDNCAGRSDA